jgi:hypothetical protein
MPEHSMLWRIDPTRERTSRVLTAGAVDVIARKLRPSLASAALLAAATTGDPTRAPVRHARDCPGSAHTAALKPKVDAGAYAKGY